MCKFEPISEAQERGEDESVRPLQKLQRSSMGTRVEFLEADDNKHAAKRK